MEKLRTYKSKRGGVYELVQVKAPEKKKRRSSGKVKTEKAAKPKKAAPKAAKPKKAAPKAAKPKKASNAQKMAGKARAVKRARKTTSKRKPGQLNLL
jgi:hypothetical protein